MPPVGVRAVVLAGGVGAARFLLGLREVLGADAADPPVTVVGNTADDLTLFGLRICPDLDSVMYTLGGAADSARGWGRAGETFTVRDELVGYGDERGWFGLGDRDLATHLLRSELLAAGVPLSQVTARLCRRWAPGVRLLPMSDDPVTTRVWLPDGRQVHFQEWWVRLRAAVPARRIEPVGAATATPGPGVVEAIVAADVVLLAPSNPVVSIGPILAVPGVRAALTATPAPVVGLSPIVAGAPVRGMADACLAAARVPVTAAAVAGYLGARSAGGVLDGWLVDLADAADAAAVRAGGLPARAVPLLMRDLPTTAAMARSALDLAADLRR